MNGIDNQGQDSSAALGHHPQLPQQQQQQQQQGVPGGGDMPEKSMDEPPAKETVDPWENFDAQSAFLGPTLWDKRVPYDGQDFKVGYYQRWLKFNWLYLIFGIIYTVGICGLGGISHRKWNSYGF